MLLFNYSLNNIAFAKDQLKWLILINILFIAMVIDYCQLNKLFVSNFRSKLNKVVYKYKMHFCYSMKQRKLCTFSNNSNILFGVNNGGIGIGMVPT